MDLDTLLIGFIEQVDVDSNGRLLITDQIGKQTLLFDSTGTLLASLDPSTCHPAFPFSPTAAVFGNDEFIFVKDNSGGYWGYQFTAEGACLGRADRSFSSPKFIDVDPEGMMYGVGAGTSDKESIDTHELRWKSTCGVPVAPSRISQRRTSLS